MGQSVLINHLHEPLTHLLLSYNFIKCHLIQSKVYCLRSIVYSLKSKVYSLKS